MYVTKILRLVRLGFLHEIIFPRFEGYSFMKKRMIKTLALTLAVSASALFPNVTAEAAEQRSGIPTAAIYQMDEAEKKGITEESYYKKVREVMPEGYYGSSGYTAENYWSCAGWVSHVLYEAGKEGAFGGYVPDYGNTATACAGDLEVFMQQDQHFELVSYYNDNCGDNARKDLNEKVDKGVIKAGDIIIYHEYGSSFASSYGKAHAAMIISERFTGSTDTYTGYGEERWPSNLVGEATVANSLNYSYGTEFYTPANAFFEVGQATGYAVYRVKAEEPEKKENKNIYVKKTVKNETSTVEGTVIYLPVNETYKVDMLMEEYDKENGRKSDSSSNVSVLAFK